MPLVRGLLAAEIVAYALVLLGAGLLAAVRRRQPWILLGLPLSIACMHLPWGAGFIWSMIAAKVPPEK